MSASGAKPRPTHSTSLGAEWKSLWPSSQRHQIPSEEWALGLRGAHLSPARHMLPPCLPLTVSPSAAPPLTLVPLMGHPSRQLGAQAHRHHLGLTIPEVQSCAKALTQTKENPTRHHDTPVQGDSEHRTETRPPSLPDRAFEASQFLAHL